MPRARAGKPRNTGKTAKTVAKDTKKYVLTKLKSYVNI
jgi:hypothetical protein